MENSLLLGQRYTFYIKYDTPTESVQKIIRANLRNIIYHKEFHNRSGILSYIETSTILVNNSDNEENKETVISIPIYLLSKIENLEMILIDTPNLNPDILLVIDSYF